MKECYCGYLQNNEEVRRSSSGGLATAIARHIVGKHGIVYGVAYTSDFKSAEFIRVTTAEDVQKLIGSKYICANTMKIGGWGTIILDILSKNRLY